MDVLLAATRRYRECLIRIGLHAWVERASQPRSGASHVTSLSDMACPAIWSAPLPPRIVHPGRELREALGVRIALAAQLLAEPRSHHAP